MKVRPLLPQPYGVDYGAWIVLSMFPLLTVAALLPIETLDGNRLAAVVICLFFSVACFAVVLLRGRGARRLAAKVRSRGDIVWALAFDEAQLQDRQGQPLRGFEDGVLSLDGDGTLGIWPVASGTGLTPLVTIPNEDRGDARSVHDFRFFAYPTISIDVNPDSVLVVRPLKPRGLPWRVGMTVSEAEEAVVRASSR